MGLFGQSKQKNPAEQVRSYEKIIKLQKNKNVLLNACNL